LGPRFGIGNGKFVDSIGAIYSTIRSKVPDEIVTCH